MVKDILSQPTSIKSNLNSSFTVNVFSKLLLLFSRLFCVPKLVWDFPRLHGIVTLTEFLSIHLYITFHFLEGGGLLWVRQYDFTQGLTTVPS